MNRFQKYLNRFKKEAPVTEEPVKKAHLGDTLAMDLSETVKKRLNVVLPYFVDERGGAAMIQCSNTSYWDQPKKYIVLNVFIIFDEDVRWKDGG